MDGGRSRRPADRPDIFPRGTQAGLLGTAAGIVAAALLGNVTLHLPLLAGGLVFVALGAALLPLMPERRFTRRLPEERESFAATMLAVSALLAPMLGIYARIARRPDPS